MLYSQIYQFNFMASNVGLQRASITQSPQIILIYFFKSNNFMFQNFNPTRIYFYDSSEEDL